MFRSIWSISSLLSGMAVLLTGSGLLGILLGLRAAQDGFGNLAIGLVMSGFYVGYMLGAWVCPPLIVRVGHVRAFASFAASAAALSLTYGMAVHPVVWGGLRVLNGLMIMGIYMVIESWLNERARGPRRSRVFSIYMMSNLFAVSVGQYLIAVHGVDGLGSFALAAILFCLGLLPIALTPLRQPVPIKSPTLSLRKLFRASRTGVAGAFGSGLALGAFWSLSAIYARALGLENVQIAHFTASAIVGGALMQWPIGWVSDRRDRRLVMIWVAVAAALALIALAVVDRVAGASFGPAWYVPLSFAFGAFVFSIYGLAVTQTHERVAAGEVLEATKGLLLLHGIGAAIGPLVTGLMMHWLQARGFPLTIAGVMVLLAAYTLSRVRREPPVPAGARGSFAPPEQSAPIDVEIVPASPAPDRRRS
ncbi:MAG: MFS transporter [Lautropia sp.]